jgi:predicted heme/steroid binding protein
MTGAALIHDFAEVVTMRRQDNNFQVAVLSYDADFVISNIIDLTIDNIAIASTPFDTDQATTIGDLATNIALNPDVASATVTDAREITIVCALAATDMMFSNVVVTGGATQATGSVGKVGGYVDGLWQTPAAADVEIEMSVQPLNGDEVVKLPEGDRSRQWMKGYTAQEMQVADEMTGRRGDFILYNGKVYEVMKSERWLQTDLNHYKVLLAEINVEWKTGTDVVEIPNTEGVKVL